MKIHYLNCGTMYPRLAPWFSPYQERSCCICMLLEAGDRLALVDTGFGTADMRDLSRLGSRSNLLLNVRPDPELPAVRQIARMGLEPGRVTDIICTHLDRDHAGGLPDFPHARVHVLAAEREAALNPGDALERDRYRRCHFAHGPDWVAHDAVSEERWFGLECVRGLPGLPPEVLLVPLPGHTRGHCGVAVDTGEGWVLHCGDAYYVKEELRETGKAPVGVRAFRRVAHHHYGAAMESLERIRRIFREHGGEVRVIASHDQFEYRALFGKPLD
ncbi:MAG: MBL fold metallo-hydrolase [Actinobacteria bacterium]|nr:MBL fold metallo-hydrolase [Actinomycetota bacterium]